MKMTMGEKASRAIRDSQACVTLGRAATRVDCALSYAEYELHKPSKVDPADISAGFHTSASSAKELLKLNLPSNVHDAVAEYSKQAAKANDEFRKHYIGKNAKPLDDEAIKLVKGQAKDLRTKANGIWASVRGLCMEPVDESFKNAVPPASSAAAGRTG